MFSVYLFVSLLGSFRQQMALQRESWPVERWILAINDRMQVQDKVEKYLMPCADRACKKRNAIDKSTGLLPIIKKRLYVLFVDPPKLRPEWIDDQISRNGRLANGRKL